MEKRIYETGFSKEDLDYRKSDKREEECKCCEDCRNNE